MLNTRVYYIVDFITLVNSMRKVEREEREREA